MFHLILTCKSPNTMIDESANTVDPDDFFNIIQFILSFSKFGRRYFVVALYQGKVKGNVNTNQIELHGKEFYKIMHVSLYKFGPA